MQKLHRQQGIALAELRHLADRSEAALHDEPRSFRVSKSQLDANRPAKGMAIDVETCRTDATLVNQVIPGSFGVLVDRFLGRECARALAVPAIIQYEHGISELA